MAHSDYKVWISRLILLSHLQKSVWSSSFIVQASYGWLLFSKSKLYFVAVLPLSEHDLVELNKIFISIHQIILV